MKKILTIITISLFLGACDATGTFEDMEMLQSKYEIVYPIDGYNYVCIDSLDRVCHIKVGLNGKKYQQKIKIK